MRRREDELDPAVQADLDALEAALAGSRDDEGLAALVAALQAERPAPDPEFKAALDGRAAEGFVSPRRRPSLPAWARLPVLAPVAGTAAAVLVVVIVIAGSSSDDADTAGGGAAAVSKPAVSEPSVRRELAPSEDAITPQALALDSAAGAGQALRVAPGSARKVEQSASLALAVPNDEVEEVADGVVRVTDRFRGIVESSSVAGGDDGAGAVFDLRIPTPRLASALAALSELGHVRRRTQDTADITREYRSARGGLREAQAERRALLRQLEQAATQGQIDAIKARIRSANRRIADARRALARVNLRAAYSRVSVTVEPGGRAPQAGGGWTPGEAWDDALAVLQVAAGIALVTLAAGIPIAIVALLAWLAARTLTRRRRVRALDGA